MAKKTGVLKEEFKNGVYRDLLKDIYVDEGVLDYQTERYIKALETYEKLYGEQEVEIYSAPGRSEVGAIIQTTSTARYWQRPSTWISSR